MSAKAGRQVRSLRHTATAALAASVLMLASVTTAALAGAGAAQAGGPAPGTISTIAGGVGGPGPARQVSIAPCGKPRLQNPCGISFADGSLYFTDTVGVVRQVSLRTGRLTSPAGAALPSYGSAGGYGGDGGPAKQAGILQPQDVSADAAGDILIADGISVRMVPASSGTFFGQAMTAGDIYTVAGGGSSTASGVPATTESLRPKCVTKDHAGNIVLCGVSSIQVVAATTGTFYGQSMTAGDIYTVAGGGTSSATGVSALTVPMSPQSVVVGKSGNLIIGDMYWDHHEVRVVPVQNGTFYGQHMTAGDIYVVAGGGSALRNAVRATRTSMGPASVAADRAGNLVVADLFDNLVRVVAVRTGTFHGRFMRAGDVYTVAGGGSSTSNGALATGAKLNHPRSVTVDSAGNIVVADQSYWIRVIAAKSGTFYGVHMAAGHMYVIAGNGNPWSSGGRGPAAQAQFYSNGAVAFDNGNLAVEGWHPTTRSLNSYVRLVAARSGTFFGQAMQAGHIYLIAGNGKYAPAHSGALGTQSPLGLADIGLAADAHGNLVITTSVYWEVLVLAARDGTFYGMTMRAGHLYRVAGGHGDSENGNGGPAINAAIEPGPVVVDGSGNLVIGATQQVRVIAERTGTFYGVPMTAGDIYTIAGNGSAGTGGDGGPAASAQFEVCDGLAVDGADGILVSDLYRVRMIATATGTFFGVPMTAGDIYTIAGTGIQGTSGDGTLATAADISPDVMTVDSAGNLLFYDDAARAVRAVPATTGTFYGVAMTGDHLSTVAGGGTGGLGDGGPATQADLVFIDGLAANATGLAISADDGLRVRLVAG
jgi:hypothetical protein